MNTGSRSLFKLNIILLSFIFQFNDLTAQDISANVKWKRILTTHDLIFKQLPRKWEEAPYFGNGIIASMLYADSLDARRLIIQVFRTDVSDHRTDSAGWTAYSRPRLSIGYFTLDLKEPVTSCILRQSLWNATLTGTIKTSSGSLVIKHFVVADKDLVITEIKKNGNEDYTIKWYPGNPVSTRRKLFPYSLNVLPAYAAAYGNKYLTTLQVYHPNPKVRLKNLGSIHLSIQNLSAGGQFVAAWKISGINQHRQIFTVTIKNSYPKKTAEKQAYNELDKITYHALKAAYVEHCYWWHHYYEKSFMSLPDKKLEGLYWLQIYKLGSASRANGPIMDTSGPWFQDTPWPYITWDLNVELCYWALNTSNHLDLALSLPNTLNRYQHNLINNVKPDVWKKDAAYLPLATAQDLIGKADDDQRYENLHANLLWIMHNVWLIYRYSMNAVFLRKKCYPLLKKSINYYLHIIKKQTDGKYHIPLGYSPEYPGKSLGREGETKDANIDISLLNWGLQTLIKSSIILKTDPVERKKWQEILKYLVDYQQDERGFKVGADLSFDLPHRHYSHLLMIYPLYLVNKDQHKNIPLIKTSLKSWAGNKKSLEGYSYTGAASISAAIGEGDTALNYLTGIYKFLLPNGLYKEKGPCFETPLSAAQSIQDMLLQSWGDKIRVFPAVPSKWKNLVFDKWLTEGAFEVSAKLENRKTAFVIIKSLAGSPCLINIDIDKPIASINNKHIRLVPLGINLYQIPVEKNQTVIIRNPHYRGGLDMNAVKPEDIN